MVAAILGVILPPPGTIIIENIISLAIST